MNSRSRKQGKYRVELSPALPLFTESYHDAYKADARELFDEFIQFIQRTSNLVAQPDVEGAAWELVLLWLMNSGLVGSLKWLNERENDLRTLQALPTNGMVH